MVLKHRLAHLDLLRLLAVALVMYGHFVGVAGGATDIYGVIGPQTKLPLIDASRWQLWRFETFLVDNFTTQSAILGVTLFFLVTGYLMPTMLERYSRAAFLINRFFRIYPVLIAACGLIGLFVGVTQNVSFSVQSYLVSMSLAYPFFSIITISGIFWTLFVEVVFYLLAASVGHFSVYRLVALQALLLLVIFISTRTDWWLAYIAALHARYLLTICIGSAVYLAEKESKWEHKVILVFASAFFCYLGFQLYRYGHVDDSNYCRIRSQVLALSLFLLFHFAGKTKVLGKIPKPVYWVADMVYPLYLLHVAFGLGTMAIVRNVTSNPYAMLIGAIAAALASASVLHFTLEVPSIKLGRYFARRVDKRATQ